MTRTSLRTTTHSYPQEEIDAMSEFYDGKRCVVQKTLDGVVEWAHILDPSMAPSNRRLLEMLTRKLRLDRHPRHAAEVRENIVPLKIDHHRAMDEHPPRSTLFLHEDILARTLSYEQDLQQWRMAELEAGRGDPGRPTYEEVFGGMPITPHRYHSAGSLGPFVREDNIAAGDVQVYFNCDCPGIDNPTSQKQLPIINTLLSIPFSLLHTLPRLAGIAPLSYHQHQLIIMGAEIIKLWWWDPSPDMVRRSHEVYVQNITANRHNGTRRARPNPINHQSRNNTMFSTKQPMIPYGTSTMPSCCNWQDMCTVDPLLGQNLFGTTSWDSNGLLLQGPESLTEMEDVQHSQHSDKGTIASFTSCLVMHEASDLQSVEDFDNVDGIKEVEEKLAIGPSSLDIISWYENIVDPVAEPLPLTPTPFKRGVIGGLSTNDVLMIKGLIAPPVYIQFLDPSSFSHI